MKNALTKSIAASAAALSLLAVASHAQTAYTIGGNGSTLVKFELATPAITTVIGTFTGATSSLQGIDFRPANGLMYGIDTTGRIVTVNLSTAATTLASTSSEVPNSGNLGIDFNPAADRLRVVTDLDQNLRINVATGAATTDGTLKYVAGDPNFGVSPTINEAAYTNNDNDPGTGTQLFYIDYSLDRLVSTLLPNNGDLNTVGPLGFDTTDRTGFDIFTSATGVNTAYAILTAPSGTATLHNINLATGQATAIGTVGTVRPYGLAIAPVPEPGTALFGLALIGASLLRRNRRHV